jgi:RNA polymerase sigma factor (sigma-70 family)
MTVGSRGAVFRSIETLFGVGSVTGMNDAELLEQFLSGQDEVAQAAFGALLANHGPLVWKVCRGVLSDAHAAEDAFQATFLILVRKARSIRRRETLAPWLYGVARRVAVRAKAGLGRRRIVEVRGAEREATTMPELSESEELNALHEELDRLPERYRAAVVLCYLEGRTHAEAARLLKCPIGTVSVRVSRARELLRARLTRRGLALSAAALAFGHDSAWAALPASLAESTKSAAMQVAAGYAMTAGVVPASVAQLTEGVLRTMSWNKLSIAATAALVAGLVPVGAGLRAISARQAQDKPGAAAPADDRKTLEARARSMNNLKQILIAFHNFAANNAQQSLPPAAMRKDGKALLSWRVALLPYLAEEELYNKFHRDEPWDSPHNKALVEQMPQVYAPVIDKGDPKGSTYYQGFFGPGTLFDGDVGTKFLAITDGTSNTLMVVEAATPVPWTKPEDIPFDPDKPMPKLGGLFERGFNAGFADGSVRFIAKTINDRLLRALITRNGGEPVSGDAIPAGDDEKERFAPPAQDKPRPARPLGPENEQEARARSMNNLKQIVLAVHNLADNNAQHSLPPVAIRKDGKALLSWRVALLPYLAEGELYNKFHRDEPWDSPHNKALVEQMPQVYAPVIDKGDPKGSTYYQGFFGRGAIFDGDVGTTFPGITDGAANTLMVVEAATAVPWTKPEDIPVDPDKPVPKLGGLFERGFNAAFVDGSVYFIAKTINERLLRALITRNGGEVSIRDTIPAGDDR